MIKIAFQTRLQDIIAVGPPEYHQKLLSANSNTVQVFVLTSEQGDVSEVDQEQPSNFLQYLLDNPLHIPDFKPMKREEI